MSELHSLCCENEYRKQKQLGHGDDDGNELCCGINVKGVNVLKLKIYWEVWVFDNDGNC